MSTNQSAGNFSSWLRRIRWSFIKNSGSVVQCGNCRGCCRSSYFIHIRPDEKEALTVIPKEFLFPAPSLAKGNVLLGYFDNGACPMLKEGNCSVYQQRPLTCRTYDCRVFTAAGILAGGDDKLEINQRIQQWKFTYATQRDARLHNAVIQATKFLEKYSSFFPTDFIPLNPSRLAILALKVYEVFLEIESITPFRNNPDLQNEMCVKIMDTYQDFQKLMDRNKG